MKIRVQYFAIFREQRGLGDETLDTSASTVGELYNDLAARHSFSLAPALVRASVNLNFVPMDTELAEGDEVVFIPPVAGG